MMYGGEPTPNSAPAPPPARPAGIAQGGASRPSGCRPKMFWKPTNMVNAPSATSTGLVGSVRSAKAPMHAPIIPAGRSTLIRSEEHTSELQSPDNLVCRLLLEKRRTSTATARAALNSSDARFVYHLRSEH